MFETMSSFLWFFFGSFALIVLGILFEEKLIQFENYICRLVYKKLHKNHARKERAK